MSKARINIEKSRGIWSEVTDYLVGDVVTRNGTSYIAIQDSLLEPPETEFAYWELANASFIVTSFAATGGSAGTDRISNIVSLTQLEYNNIGTGNYIEDYLYVIKG